MRVLITGIDGYLGWPLALHLAARGHRVHGVDNFTRRTQVREVGGHSAIPIATIMERLSAANKLVARPYGIEFDKINLLDHRRVRNIYKRFDPEAIVYLGEIPSAPYSMMDLEHAALVQENNVIGTLTTLFTMRDVCPDAHLLKLGTMGEYGTPDCEIPEGYFPEGSEWVHLDERPDDSCLSGRRRGSLSGLMFPRRGGSWYHLSKVHDTHNVEFACRIWGLRSTDIMQGVVYGTGTDETRKYDLLATRFDYDQHFGTVINRFCAQAVMGIPITPFGAGRQRRGFIPLRESIECVTRALENPPKVGEYRTFNQFAQVYSIVELASIVIRTANRMRLKMPRAVAVHLENPRIENENHQYKPNHEHLESLGYKPSKTLEDDVGVMLEDLTQHRDRLLAKRYVCLPDVHWDGTRQRCQYLTRAPVSDLERG